MPQTYQSKKKSLIISIEGSRAVGKTTLLKGMHSLFPDAYIRMGFEKSTIKFNLDLESDFLACEKWYIQREINTLKKLRNQGLSLIARGPESIEFHCLYFPSLTGKSWNTSLFLEDDLAQLQKYRSDKILYLSASKSTLKKRAKLDIKNRNGLDEWFNVWHPAMESFLLSLPNVHVIDTNTLEPEKVQYAVFKWIESLMIDNE